MGLSKDQLSEMEEAFTLFDSTGDGKIDYDQVGNVLRSLGLNPMGSDVKKIEGGFKPKRVSFEEFIPVFEEESKKPPLVREDFVEGLKVFDREGNGCIDTATFLHILCNMGDKITEEEATTLVLPLEDQKKNEVSYEEMIKLVMSPPPSSDK